VLSDRRELVASEVFAAHQLLANYARYADEGQADAWAALFGDDGVLAAFGREFTGQERLTRFALRSPRGVHIVSSPHLSRGDDDVVMAHSSFLFVNGETAAVMAGWYRDQMVPGDDGQFLFVRRGIDLRVGGEGAS
jgi:3-phenylpropionate/cinnamic acid dioxygenase small subunit